MMTGRFEAFGWGGNHGTGAMKLRDFFHFSYTKETAVFFLFVLFFY